MLFASRSRKQRVKNRIRTEVVSKERNKERKESQYKRNREIKQKSLRKRKKESGNYYDMEKMNEDRREKSLSEIKQWR